MPVAEAQVPESTSVVLTPISIIGSLSQPGSGMIPYSSTVRDRTSLDRTGRPNRVLSDVLGGVVGVQVQDRFNYALGDRLSIRGFGARAQFGVRGVKVYVDGIPATLPDGQTTLDHVEPGLVTRIEVIRGAVSSFYGNAGGGVIHLGTQLARRGVRGMGNSLRSTLGSNGLRRVQTELRGARGDLVYGVSGTRFVSSGFRDHSTASRTNLSGQLSFSAAGGSARVSSVYVYLDALNPGSLDQAALDTERTEARAFNVSQRTRKRVRQGQLGVVWNRRSERGAIEVAGYAIHRDLFNPIPTSVIDLSRFTTGLRFTATQSATVAKIPARISFGGEFNNQRDDRANFNNDNGSPGALTLDQRETVRESGGFVQLGVQPAARVHVLGGVRYDRFRFAVTDHFVIDDSDDSGTRTMDALSPSLGAYWSAFGGGEAAFFVNVSSAFQTPTTTELVNKPSGLGGLNDQLDPQRTLSAEVGARGIVAGISFAVSAFSARVTDALVPFEVAAVPGRTFFRNAGSAIHKGVEVETRGHLTDAIVFSANYAFLSARFQDFTTVDGTFDGNLVPGVVPHVVNVGLGYEVAKGFIAVETRFFSRVTVDDANSAFSQSFVASDLRAGIFGLDIGGLATSPFAAVTNVLDVDYNGSVVVNAFGDRFFEPAPGREVFFGLEVGF